MEQKLTQAMFHLLDGGNLGTKSSLFIELLDLLSLESWFPLSLLEDCEVEIDDMDVEVEVVLIVCDGVLPFKTWSELDTGFTRIMDLGLLSAMVTCAQPN